MYQNFIKSLVVLAGIATVLIGSYSIYKIIMEFDSQKKEITITQAIEMCRKNFGPDYSVTKIDGSFQCVERKTGQLKFLAID
ncbi:MAG: hypothetical protein OHK0017_08000 [Patescibacteria group bacterium]